MLRGLTAPSRTVPQHRTHQRPAPPPGAGLWPLRTGDRIERTEGVYDWSVLDAVVRDDAEPIRLWEVWNEPDIEGWWSGRPDARECAALLEVVAPAIRAADPDARVALGALTNAGASTEGGYLDQLYDLGVVDEVADRPVVLEGPALRCTTVCAQARATVPPGAPATVTAPALPGLRPVWTTSPGITCADTTCTLPLDAATHVPGDHAPVRASLRLRYEPVAGPGRHDQEHPAAAFDPAGPPCAAAPARRGPPCCGARVRCRRAGTG